MPKGTILPIGASIGQRFGMLVVESEMAKKLD